MNKKRILCLSDSPTLATGFSNVVQNLYPHWLEAGVDVDVWGIGYTGLGYSDWPGLRLIPPPPGGDWRHPRSLEMFLEQLARLDATGQSPLYTHCFILQDTFHFSEIFCEAFRHVCSQRGIRSLMYFPVDAPLEPEWTNILTSVDVAVAYTKFGAAAAAAAAAKASKRLKPKWLPHGVDTNVFKPAPDKRAEDRRMWQYGESGKPVVFCGADDFLLLNVNTNQWRKDLPRTLEIFAALLQRDIPAKLVMHCRAVRPEGTDLESVGRQFGLQLGRDWIHMDNQFGPHDMSFMGYDVKGRALVGSRVTQADMARMYNAADMVISTSLGEGWGLSITESLACGTPVAIPNHTSCAEIASEIRHLDPDYADEQFVLLEANDRIVMPAEMSRVRQRVQMSAVDAIAACYRSGEWRRRPAMPESVRQWLSWPRVAREMLDLLLNASAPSAPAVPCPVSQTQTMTL